MPADTFPTTAAQRPLCFVIGPIGGNGSDTRKHADMLLNAVVRHVLETEQFGYRVKRSDEDTDPGMIGDRVVIDILNAELVVADLTELNPNAFYELGIRHATEKPTIHIARTGTALPFDNISHRTLFVDVADWHSIESSRKALADLARAIKEPGFHVSNPITQANASFKMRGSADPRDRVIGGLQERLFFIEEQLGEFDRKRNLRGKSTSPAFRNSLIVIDTRPLLGKVGRIFKISHTKSEGFQDLLDQLFMEMSHVDGSLVPRKYGIQWYLENEDGGRIAIHRNENGIDLRSLSEVGIENDSLLLTKPVSPNWRSL